MPDNNESTLDVKGLECPEPIRRAKLALLDLAAGRVLRVLTTDPSAAIDFEAFCYHLPHELLAIKQMATHIEITIRKG